MPGLFIDVEVDAAVAKDEAIARRIEEACPVDIFDASGGALRIVEANLDECTLCDLCIQAAPDGAVRVVRLYERD